MLTFLYMEIFRNLTEAMLNSGNGPFGHFGDLFGAGLLGAVHSVMTSFYESSAGARPAIRGGSAPNLSEVIGSEFNLPSNEATTLAEVLASSDHLTLSDVIGN